MSINFNNAEPSKGDFDLIPDKSVAPVRMSMRGIKATKANDAQMLDCEFVVLEGPYAKRRFWGNMMVSSNGSEGHDKAVNITMSTVRGILESAYGINPSDESETAIMARQIDDWPDLDGLEFVARIGIEKGKGGYSDKNVLRAVVTPDSDDYAGFKPVKPVAPKAAMQAAQSAPSQANGASRPAWA